jgi:hypothetical protein
MLEHEIELHFKKQAIINKMLTFKLRFIGFSGAPDRLLINKGVCYFVELKRPNGRVRILQKVVHNLLLKHGVFVHVFDTKLQIDDFYNLIQQGQNANN